MLPDNFKNKDSVESFKMAIKEWKPDSCPCRLCKTYVQNIGNDVCTRTNFLLVSA